MKLWTHAVFSPIVRYFLINMFFTGMSQSLMIESVSDLNDSTHPPSPIVTQTKRKKLFVPLLIYDKFQH